MDTFHPHTKEKIRLKKLARQIRDIKNDLHYKGSFPEITGLSAAELQKKLNFLKYVFRHRHIAYCLNRGKRIVDIEDGQMLNKRSWNLINVFRMELYENTVQYYRKMVDFLIEDSKTKDRDLMKLWTIERLWDLWLEDDRDPLDSVSSLINSMSFIMYELFGPIDDEAIDFKIYPALELDEDNIFDIPAELEKELEQDEATKETLMLAEGMMPDNDFDEDDIIELTDEITFIADKDGIIFVKNIQDEIIPEGYCSGACHNCTDTSPCLVDEPDPDEPAECDGCRARTYPGECDECIGFKRTPIACLNCYCDVCVGNCLCDECRKTCKPEKCDNYETEIPCICTHAKHCPRGYSSILIRTGKAAENHVPVHGPDLQGCHCGHAGCADCMGM